MPLSVYVYVCGRENRLPSAFSCIPLHFPPLACPLPISCFHPAFFCCGASLHLHFCISSLALPTLSSTTPSNTFQCCLKKHAIGWVTVFVWIRLRLFFFFYQNLAVTCLLLLASGYHVCFCKITSLGEKHPLDRATPSTSLHPHPSRRALTTLLMLLRFPTVHKTFCVSTTLPTIRFYVPRPGEHQQMSSPVSKTCATFTLLQEQAHSGDACHKMYSYVDTNTAKNHWNILSLHVASIETPPVKALFFTAVFLGIIHMSNTTDYGFKK